MNIGSEVNPPVVHVALSGAEAPAQAVAELVPQLCLNEACFVLIFIPESLVGPAFEAAVSAHLSGVSVFGCTTAGQITPEGYATNTLLALSFPKAHFRCASRIIAPLNPLSIETISEDVRRLDAKFQKTANWNRLALTFADGLSRKEDLLMSALVTGLADIPVFGGSAGDGLEYRETFVLHNGRFTRDAALVLLLETDLDFVGIGFDHFLPTEKQLVITRAIADRRIAEEINGSPAAEEYARLVGCALEDLSPLVFAENPLLVRNNDAYHVRAIQEVLEGQTLSFLSAIDDGLLMTLGTGKEILRTMEEALDLHDGRGVAPEFILGFDCVLRRLEIEQKGMGAAVSEILRNARVLGFNTYGEQHHGVHVNQTFVGVAFFRPRRRELH
ncbi:FIST N-terminal domain-containing protein [Poseidonocella sedimentorum]|uniref:Uncharacterized conserved protein, contains FIST_N domain n=1 Tax=Poseidonocella sedimentorum TaxID=871652 RepID=A0A1I6D3U5_9RHOB|nr:FIST N-terminal domain-containing protein [Poseidonocella sedimentorum]SFR00139.1 Uncharacterized conserved protein, contains FIST_N domain [Poseidonocella sedimentorum]